MGNTVEVRLSEEELEILRSSVEAQAQALSQELQESMSRSSDSEILEVTDKIRAAQAAKYKLDVKA